MSFPAGTGVCVVNTVFDDAILFVVDTMPFYYIRETLTDDGVIMKREIVKGEEIDKKFEQ